MISNFIFYVTKKVISKKGDLLTKFELDISWCACFKTIKQIIMFLILFVA